MNEWRIFGPPGTGKTTYIARQYDLALRKYEKSEIFACSFTKAAAQELSSRGSDSYNPNVGTIHALCMRFMGEDKIQVIESEKELMDEWVRKYPQWPIDPTDDRSRELMRDMDQDMTMLAHYNLARARMEPVPDFVAPFVEAWEDFKDDTQSWDYSDMLDAAPDRLPGCKVLFVDEAQDLTPKQWQIVRQWGSHADQFIVAGDDDQMLYSFTGADVDQFLTPIPESSVKILDRSYRLKSKIHEYSVNWIKRLGDRRQPKDFAPHEDGGKISMLPYTYKDAEQILASMKPALTEGKSIMLLGSCGYMLEPVIRAMRDMGISYHNPYRPDFGPWNPLGSAKMPGRMLKILEFKRKFEEGKFEQLTDKEFWRDIIDPLNARGNAIQRHGKKALSEMGEHVHPFHDIAGNVLTDEAMMAIRNADFDWYTANLTKAFQKTARYPMKIWQRNGEDGLKSPPQIIVSSIHSVKGGQADVVFLMPDLSYRQWGEFEEFGGDNFTRMFYVGMTRAKDELVLLEPAEKQWVDWRTGSIFGS